MSFEQRNPLGESENVCKNSDSTKETLKKPQRKLFFKYQGTTGKTEKKTTGKSTGKAIGETAGKTTGKAEWGAEV